MKKFIVLFKVSKIEEVSIEAKDKHEAIRLAELEVSRDHIDPKDLDINFEHLIELKHS